jgi:hypothetical protein
VNSSRISVSPNSFGASEGRRFTASADTFALAICRAALKAVAV